MTAKSSLATLHRSMANQIGYLTMTLGKGRDWTTLAPTPASGPFVDRHHTRTVFVEAAVPIKP